MFVHLKYCVFIALLIGMINTLETDYIDDPEENTRQFIRDENVKTRDLINEDVNRLFNEMSESFTLKLTTLMSEMEKSIATLSESLQKERMTNELKIERSIGNLSEFFNGSLTQIVSEVRRQKEIMEENHVQVSRMVGNLTLTLSGSGIRNGCLHLSGLNNKTATLGTPPTVVDVKRVDGLSGLIEFNGTENPSLRRKIWIIGGDVLLDYFEFTMEQNNLGPYGHLTVGNFKEIYRTYNGSQEDWRNTSAGFVKSIICVTLSLRTSPQGIAHPSFKFRFNSTELYRPDFNHTFEVLHRNGVQKVSNLFPNTENNYSKTVSMFFIANPSGKSFQLTLKYLDVDCTDSNKFGWLFLDEYFEEPHSEEAKEASTKCGNLGNISEVVGYGSFAFVGYSDEMNNATEKGFILEVNPD